MIALVTKPRPLSLTPEHALTADPVLCEAGLKFGRTSILEAVLFDPTCAGRMGVAYVRF